MHPRHKEGEPLVTIHEFFRGHPYFQGLTDQQVAEIARRATARSLQRGEILAMEGEPCQAVYWVFAGRLVALKYSAQGRELAVREFTPGQSFYLVPALDGGPLPTTTQAATRSTVIALPRQDFLGALQRHPAMAWALLQDMARRLREFSALVEDLALRSVPERLAKLLLERAMVRERLTQREMAAQLGTVREVVARTLAQFGAAGWIRLERGRIEIVDAAALRELAARGNM